MADKVLSVKVEVVGPSTEANAIESLILSLKKLKEAKATITKAYTDGKISEDKAVRDMAALTREINTQKDTLNNLKKVVDSAPDSLNRMRAELIRAKDAAANCSTEIREKMSPYINQMTNDVKKAEEAMGTHTRGVGNYKESIKNAAKELFAFAAPAAAAMYALNGLKEAFLGTERGAQLLIRAKLQMSAFFDNIVEGNFKYAFGNQLPKDIKAVADLMNRIRIDERNEIVGISKRELEIKELRLKSVKAAGDLVEQARLLERAETKENELIAFKLIQKEEELDAVKELLKNQKTNTLLLDKQAQLEAEINNIKGEKSLRIASKLEAIQAKITKDTETQRDSEMFMSELEGKRVDKERKSADEAMKRATQGMGVGSSLFGLTGVTAGKIKTETQKSTEDIGNIIDKANENIRKDQETHDKAMLDMAARTSESKMNIANAAVNVLNVLGGKSKTIQKAALLAEKIVAIAQITMQARIASMATTAWGAAYSIPTFGASIVAATVINAKNKIAEIFNIGSVIASAAVGFARGGKINRGIPINTGTVDNKLIAVNNTETVLTAQHVQSLGGSGVMQRIGVPGYANGGYVGQQAPSMPAAGFDYNAMAQLMNSIEVTLNLNKLNSGLKELSIINQTQKI